MGMRSTESTAIFHHPFLLASLGEVQPPGTYRVVVDEEEVVGLSFLAYRRVATWFHLPAIEFSSMASQVFIIDLNELVTALASDRRSRLEPDPSESTS
jgi:hypothetical protein